MAKTTLLLAIISLVAVGSVVAAYATMVATTDQENKTLTTAAETTTGYDVEPASNASFTEPEADLSTPEIEPNFGDGSICADYEPGEMPPAHLNCDEIEPSEGKQPFIITDRQVYGRSETVIVSGWADPTAVYDRQVKMGMFDSEGKLVFIFFAEVNDDGSFVSDRRAIPDNEVFTAGQWRVGFDYEDKRAVTTFEVVDGSNAEGFSISLPPGVTPEQHALWWKDVQECYSEQLGIEAPGVIVDTNGELQAHLDLLEECGVKDMKEYGNDEDERRIVDGLLPLVEGSLSGTIVGPGAEECTEPLENAVTAVLKTDNPSELSYISEHVQEVYCNDVHVVISGIPYSHNAYVLSRHPDRVYLNPAAYTMYDPERLAITLFHEVRHLEQHEECKADRSKCMTQEEREIDAQRFGNEMWDKLFPYEDAIIVIPPMETTANIVILNNGTETITPRTNSTITIVGTDSDHEATTTMNYTAIREE